MIWLPSYACFPNHISGFLMNGLAVMNTLQVTRATMARFRCFGIYGMFLISGERGFNHGLIEGGKLL